jgi:transposase
MNDKAPQATNLKDAQTLINQLWAITRVQEKTIDVLTQQVSSLSRQVDSLTVEVKTLKEKLSKNSQNSSKPPSSDGYSKPAPKSLRKKSGKPSGGQRDHKGQTLRMVVTPDIVEEYEVTSCTHCCADLSHAPIIDVARRQIFDLPPIELQVTEH